MSVLSDTAPSITLTFRTDEEKRATLDKIAASLDRNRNWVINEALDLFIESHRWQMERLARAKQEARDGLGVPVSVVREEIRKRSEARSKK